MSEIAAPPPQPLTPRQRLFSLAELVIGAGLVIGHNVFHKVPNEVPILFVLGWISIQVRNGGWKNVGLRNPDSWTKTILWAISAAVLLQVSEELVINPITAKIWHRAPDVSSVFNDLKFNVKEAAKALLLVWTFAAFGEEMGYRGYLLNRAAEVGNRSKYSYFVALLLVSILFGYGHYYKGPAGIVESTVSGLILGGLYLMAGRNLWAPILAHGLSDTFAVVIVFFGWAT
jgi:hypothetical protein